MPDGFSRRRVLTAAGAALGGALAGCTAEPSAESETDPETDLNTSSNNTDNPESPVAVSGEFTETFRNTADEVVQIRVLGGDTRGASGTGWLYNEDHIVTNEHVVGGGEDVFVRFKDTGWVPAEVVASDVYSDLGVLYVEDVPDDAEPLPLVTEDPPVGTQVLAIGNPFGLSGSVSTGIVSGTDRRLPAPNNFSIPDAIQTDAAVNPGNSGGPLVDVEGNVVGVINSGGGDNIGFAISGAMVDQVIPALIETGNYEHTYIGIGLQEVTPSIAAANDLEVASGIYVITVDEDGPSAGVLQGTVDETVEVFGRDVPVGGDVIVAMDGTPIPTQQALSSFLALETRPGDTIEVEIIRDGRRRTVEVTLGARPAPSERDPL
jgi:S1-C subfamily serine protease